MGYPYIYICSNHCKKRLVRHPRLEMFSPRMRYQIVQGKQYNDSNFQFGYFSIRPQYKIQIVLVVSSQAFGWWK